MQMVEISQECPRQTNTQEHNLCSPQIPDHSYRILISGDCGSGKMNILLNLTSRQPRIDEIFLYTMNAHEPKYQLLINKRQEVDLNNLKDLKAFIKYSNDMNDVYCSNEVYNPRKKTKVLIIIDDMIALI